MGAYVWGVLDAFLEDGRLEFEGVTGTSSGAINAAALADGLAAGGTQGARAALRAFWISFAEAAERRRVGRVGRAARALRRLAHARSSGAFQEIVSHAVTDFRLDPARMEPLRSVLAATIDFARLRHSSPLRVFANATNVRTQELRVFKTSEITVDSVCASACIPLLFQAVEIDGEPYWDGSFLGNPAIFPVIYECRASDIVLIETRPAGFVRTPTSASEILARMVNLGARAALTREVRMIDFVSDLVRRSDGKLLPTGVREVRLHRVTPVPALAGVEGASGFRADRSFFEQLFEVGRQSGRVWLENALTPSGERHA